LIAEDRRSTRRRARARTALPAHSLARLPREQTAAASRPGRLNATGSSCSIYATELSSCPPSSRYQIVRRCASSARAASSNGRVRTKAVRLETSLRVAKAWVTLGESVAEPRARTAYTVNCHTSVPYATRADPGNACIPAPKLQGGSSTNSSRLLRGTTRIPAYLVAFPVFAASRATARRSHPLDGVCTASPLTKEKEFLAKSVPERQGSRRKETKILSWSSQKRGGPLRALWAENLLILIAGNCVRRCCGSLGAAIARLAC